jgi:hypothetical protein
MAKRNKKDKSDAFDDLIGIPDDVKKAMSATEETITAAGYTFPKSQVTIFIREYAMNGMNCISALESAGIYFDKWEMHKIGAAILRRTATQEMLREFSKDAIKEVELTVTEVLESLRNVKQIALAGYYDAQGNHRVETHAYLRATELQGKYLGLFGDKLKIELDGHSELMKIIMERKGNGKS